MIVLGLLVVAGVISMFVGSGVALSGHQEAAAQPAATEGSPHSRSHSPSSYAGIKAAPGMRNSKPADTADSDGSAHRLFEQEKNKAQNRSSWWSGWFSRGNSVEAKVDGDGARLKIR